jgi:hypothetical protein
MKFFICIIGLMLIGIATQAQLHPNLGIQLNNSGVEMLLGVKHLKHLEQVDIQFNYNHPIGNDENLRPRITSLTAGYELLLTNKSDYGQFYNFTFTPSIGLANVNTIVFNEEESDILDIKNRIKPIYKVEIGKDSYCGRFILTASYVDRRTFFGGGIRIILRDN